MTAQAATPGLLADGRGAIERVCSCDACGFALLGLARLHFFITREFKSKQKYGILGFMIGGRILPTKNKTKRRKQVVCKLSVLSQPAEREGAEEKNLSLKLRQECQFGFLKARFVNKKNDVIFFYKTKASKIPNLPFIWYCLPDLKHSLALFGLFADLATLPGLEHM